MTDPRDDREDITSGNGYSRFDYGEEPDTRRVVITAVETIHYSKEYDLVELEEYLGLSLDRDFDGRLDQFVSEIQEKAHSYPIDNPGFAEDLEENGDVQGQEWSGEFAE